MRVIVHGLVIAPGCGVRYPDSTKYLYGLLLAVQQPFRCIPGLCLGLPLLAKQVTGVLLFIECHRKPGECQNADSTIHNQHHVT
ncbi:hypothetical protein AV903_19620 [Erwinia tracheiphila]|uniref:Uncharacterized protein n=1 Tax=Erwinia tracheiphila TaxID=65700 RepID=A0A345CWD2_9GAMM|nr:hypothetical protein AV903_19620 [Erwinia tracheiphila]